MDIFKVVGVGIIGAIISIFLKETKPEFFILCVVCTGVIILIFLLNYMMKTIETFSDIVKKTNIDESLFAGILKIIGIGYVTEYSSEICEDMNCSSIASKLRLAGKIVIFVSAFPIMSTFIDLISKFVT